MGNAAATRGAVGGAVAIIPARLGSTRFPRKVLADRTGSPLIRHVWEAVSRATSVGRVVVATDAPDVASAVQAFGGEAVMTGEHPNGTSRLDEAAARLGLADDVVVVNAQGDEPELEPSIIDAAVEALESSPWAEVSTIASPFQPGEDPANPNIVKAVLGVGGRALYFSRALVPFVRTGGAPVPPLKHVGLYVYRRRTLATYVRLQPTPLEQAEMLEQLRLLEHGVGIVAAVRAVHTTGIDTPEQYDSFVSRRASGSASRRG